MKYYKILQDENFIGVISSDNFKKYYRRGNFLGPATEETGQLVLYKDKYYRDTWMKSAIMLNYIYELAQIFQISEEEYNNLYEIIESSEEPLDQEELNELIIEEVPEEEEIVIRDPLDDITVEEMKRLKIKEMSRTCNKTIEAGFDITLSNEIHHFSLTVQDQLNLISLSSMATQGIPHIPYHADGELCKYYTPEEINAIVNQGTYFKTYHTTYFNGLKAYINSLETIEEINAITYGTPLPEEYQTDVWKELNQ